MKNWTRKLAILAITTLSVCSHAQSFPTRPIKAIVGYGPGGVTDIIARVVSEGMSKHLGQPVTVENRPGASGLVAANAVKIAAPDGYTVFVGPTTGFAPLYIKDNPLLASKELTAVSNFIYGDWFLYVSSSIGVSSLKELVAYSKANPGKVRFASPATTNGMFMALIGKQLGINYEEIPYKTTDQTIMALITGDAQITINAAQGFGPQIQAGKLKAISTFSPQRTELMPTVATAAEQDMPLTIRFTTGLWAPPGTPKNVVDILNRAAVEALKDPEVQSKLKNASLLPGSSSPEAMVADLEAQLKVMAVAASAANFKPQ